MRLISNSYRALGFPGYNGFVAGLIEPEIRLLFSLGKQEKNKFHSRLQIGQME